MTKYQKLIFNPLATINSISPFVSIYLLKVDQIKMKTLLPWKIEIDKFHIFINSLYINAIFHLLLLLIFTGMIIFLSCFLDSDTEKIPSDKISSAQDTFIPVYLGLFFVALSVPDGNIPVFLFTYVLMFIFIYTTNSYFYNPMFYLLGFNSYYVNTDIEKKILIITRKKDFNDENPVDYNNLRRINNYSFIDLEKYKK